MSKFRNIRSTGNAGMGMMLGGKQGELAVLGGKMFHSATDLGGKISSAGHVLLDNPLTDILLGSVAPELLIAGKTGLSLLDRGLSLANPASRVIEQATKRSGVNPLRYA